MPRPKPQTPPSVSRGLRLAVELDRKVSKRMRTLKLSRNAYFAQLAHRDLDVPFAMNSQPQPMEAAR